MNKINTFAAALAASLLPLSAPIAQEVEYEAIEEKKLISGQQALSEDKAYIFVSGPTRNNGVFIKTPDDADLAEYRTEWAEEFEEAKRKHPGRLKRWQARKEKRRGNPGAKPIEPTEDNFAISEIERRLMVSFGPQFVYSKGKTADGEKTFSYLIEVEPGEYTYYGPMLYLNGTAGGLCFCMGSVKFDAPAGQVTSLGDFLSFQWVSDEAARKVSVFADDNQGRVAKPVDYAVPQNLAEFGSAPVDLRAAGKMNNFFGVLFERMPPIEGVLDYDRDIPIDVKGLVEGKVEVVSEAASPTVDAEVAGEAVDDIDSAQ